MPLDVDCSKTTLAILAGGMGRRMGLPKGQLRLAGRPILEYLLDQFAWPGETLLVTGPGLEHPPGAARFDREASDPAAGEGPLRGVLTALENAKTPETIVVTVDMPTVRPEQLRWMIARLRLNRDAAGMMFSRLAEREVIEPFPMVCRAKAAAAVESHYRQGKRAVHSLLEVPAFFSEPVPDEWPAAAWTNLNRPGELAKFEAEARGER